DGRHRQRRTLTNPTKCSGCLNKRIRQEIIEHPKTEVGEYERSRGPRLAAQSVRLQRRAANDSLCGSAATNGRRGSPSRDRVEQDAPRVAIKRKEPPGNRAALPLGRIVPTEAKPSELSGCIVGSGFPGVK